MQEYALDAEDEAAEWIDWLETHARRLERRWGLAIAAHYRGALAAAGGELDVATADAAFGYVREIIDRCGGPVVVNLAGVRFCDARGLHALVRMSHYAQRANCRFRVISPSPRLTKPMQITGLGETSLAAS